VPWLHLALGLCALSRYSAPLVGIGILGPVHRLDPEIRALPPHRLPDLPRDRVLHDRDAHPEGRLEEVGFIVLYALMGLTLLWASVEKWGYPQWTYPLLERDPSLLMGLKPYPYMVLAGFVEFNVDLSAPRSGIESSRAPSRSCSRLFSSSPSSSSG
jgi:hypothetical protein